MSRVSCIPQTDGHGNLELKWTEGDLMPKELVDVEEEDLPESVMLTDIIFESDI